MKDVLRDIGITAPAASGPCMATSAIRDALAILDAIGQGGLFDGVPDSENERQRHLTGVTLLELLETRLRQAVGEEVHLGSVDCCCGEVVRANGHGPR